MSHIANYRWSDNDHRVGPFIYARDRRYKSLSVMLDSGDWDERLGCRLRLSAFGHTFIVALPPVIKPWHEKVFPNWDVATVLRLGRNWYWNTEPREFGFHCAEGHFGLHFGRQSHDSRTERSKGWFLPWTQWRHVRHSFYDLTGELFWTEPTGDYRLGQQVDWNTLHTAQQNCPSQTFSFVDYDGEKLSASTRIEEREWHFGEGWFKWLSWFRAPKIHRTLDIHFSGETGRRKGSWKGGTIGTGIDMRPGEFHQGAFRRYCAENNMEFGCAQ